MTRARDTIAKRTAPHGAGDGVALPLFAHDHLRRLQDERARLAQRIQHLPAHSGLKYELIGRLKALTAQAMRLELDLRETRR